MAQFREHIAVGAVASVAIVTSAYSYGYITDPVMLTTLFALTTIASFTPDLDSDSGLPFHLIFGTFSVLCGAAALYLVLQTHQNDWRYLAGIPLAVLAAVWIIAGTIFKKFTEHRGMMHSTPAAVIAGLLTFLAARYLALPQMQALIFAAAVTIGYTTHLVLDEIWAGFSADGIPFLPKKSLGTAIKFFSPHSKLMNVATYGILFGLVYFIVSQP